LFTEGVMFDKESAHFAA